MTDPIERKRLVEAAFLRECRKMAVLGADGWQLTPATPEPTAPESAVPERRLPAPNPAQGSSASGPPPLDEQIREATARRDWAAVIMLQGRRSGIMP
jgi:hypothetical protein